ncbi:MAG: hypothetical protein JRI23_32805 [Deltaproteobacteria bacterium]|jgi:hypothetical protein|nr:hypothetical protein [Deltaproteobacteria bacterium]MBW2537033.1 hypothetical protein [Deltaproteobacteria bacterium]
MSTFKRVWDVIIVALFLAVIATVVPVDQLLPKWKVKLPARAPFKKVGKIVRAELYDGRAGIKFERDLMNRSYAGRWLTAHHNELVYRLTRRSTPASWLGRDNWLFVTQRVREFHRFHWDGLLRFDVDAIEKVHREVERHGAHLVVALVPDRARIYPDKAYHGGRMPAGKQAFLPQLERLLSDRGIPVIDLTEALQRLRDQGTAPFYSDDHHWTSSGAEAAAKAIVAGLPSELATIVAPTEKTPRFEVTWNRKDRSKSSLTRKLGFWPEGDLESSFRIVVPRAKHSGRRVKRWPGTCATYWSTSYGLFGSPESFTNEVRCPVRTVYKGGRGSGWAPLRDIPKLRKAGDLGGKHLIVWEIPEYHLVEGYGVKPDAFEDIHRYFARQRPRAR